MPYWDFIIMSVITEDELFAVVAKHNAFYRE